jgi:chaperonin cofactor prefoldin
MDWQIIINLVGGAVIAAIGWFARELWTAVQNLKTDIQRIEVDLPTSYVRKADLEAKFDKLEATLQRILDKLDLKADK